MFVYCLLCVEEITLVAAMVVIVVPHTLIRTHVRMYTYVSYTRVRTIGSKIRTCVHLNVVTGDCLARTALNSMRVHFSKVLFKTGNPSFAQFVCRERE